MRATSIGHAGILIESEHGSIVCDPWFVPAFFGSWFPFPRNDQLSEDLRSRIEGADFLYVSHLHGDHWDEPWLREHLPRDIGVLLPGYPSRELDRRMKDLGFTNLVRTKDKEELDLGGLTVAIHVETSITDGPGGDSALVVSDGDVRIVDQNDCRTTDLDALRAHGARRPALAAVQRRHLVPDGLRAAGGPDAPARRRQGREPAGPGDALRRVGGRPCRRAQRRPAVLPRPGPVPPQRRRRRRAEHLRRPAGLPRSPGPGRPRRGPGHPRHRDRGDVGGRRRPPPDRRRRRREDLHRQGPVPRRVPARLAGLARRA